MTAVLDINDATNLIHSPFSRRLRRPANLASILGSSAVLLAIMVITAPGVAQTPGPSDGIALFSTHEWGLDMASSTIHLPFPVRSKAGKMPYSSSVEETNYYSVVVIKGTAYWALWGQPSFRDTLSQASLSGTATTGHCTNTTYSFTTYTVNSITDGAGTQHPLPNQFSWIRVTNNQGCVNQSQKSAGSLGVSDNTGYVVYANTTGFPIVYDKAGNAFTIPVPSVPGFTTTKFSTVAGTATDPDGVSISGNENVNAVNAPITDTLNTTALNLTTFVNAGYVEPTGASYTDASGGTQPYTMVYTALPLKTNFNCSSTTIVENSGTYNLLTSIQSPSGQSYTISYEPTPGFSGYYTGRVAQITFPSGGSISYAYSDGNGNNGMDCGFLAIPVAPPPIPTITVTVNDNNGNVSTYTYVHSGIRTTPITVTKTDPGGNQTVYTFSGEFQTEAQYYQGSATGTPLKTVITCYNANFTSCANPSSVSLPITRTDLYTSQNGSPYSVAETKYDGYGNVTYEAAYDYNQALGAAPSGVPLQATITSYASIGTYIRDKPSCTQTTSGSAPSSCGTITSNTTSLSNYTNYTSSGHAKTISRWVSGSSFLTSNYTYNTNGTVATMTDVNGALDTYAYNGTNGCNGLLPTSVTVTGAGLPSAGLKTSTQWDCNGGVATQTTDPNSQSTINTYNDPLWRLTSVQDPAGTTSICYGIISGQTCTPNATQRETVLAVNGTTSAVDSLTTIDGLGRTLFEQKRQTPTSSTFDSVQYTYGWNTTGAVTTVSMPYSGTQDQAAPSGTSTTTQHDALGRAQSVTNPGTGAGVVTSAFNQNDVLQTVSPAPSGENTKQKQFQYDGLGRLTSVCEITAGSSPWLGGNCAQTSAQIGYWTTYVYDSPTNSLTVTQNAQGLTTQTRSYTYDGLGRLTSETNPESGTKSYVWDTTPASSCGATQTFNGDLVRTVDANGTNVCSYYDALHRLTDVGTNRASTDGCRRFRYDNTKGVTGTMPTGVSVANTMGRLAEAETDSCSPFPPTSATITTDEWLSYDNDGRSINFYESTPHSTGYYNVAASYWANGSLDTLNGVSLPTLTYGVDGEGRAQTVSASSGVNPVTSTTYNSAGQATDVVFGSTDPVHFGYDSNTGRMTQYKLTINGTATHGDPTWNANGTFASLAITDPFNASDAQTCNYGYDDMARLASVNCLHGTTNVWNQNFTYDPFGNITKSVPSGGAGQSFQPGYNEANNQYTDGATYDADGNLTNDGTDHVYTWDAYGDPITLDSFSLIYDALGRQVEKQNGTGYTETVFGPTGKVALMNGQTQTKAFVPLPGGTQVKYAGSTISTYRLPDWLGSFRVGSNPNRTYSWGIAFAPFGEQYAPSGGAALSFTGEEGSADTVNDEYDFLARKLHSAQGRWISPDPAGFSAADLENPQSWNRYSYVGNSPLSAVDPTGLAPRNQDIVHTLITYCTTGTDIGIGYIGMNPPCVYTGLAEMRHNGDVHCLEQIGGGTIQSECSLVAGELVSGFAVICQGCSPGTIVDNEGFIRQYGCKGDCGYFVVGKADDAGCQAPFVCGTATKARLPQRHTPQKPQKHWLPAIANYFGFLACEEASVAETITNEESSAREAAYGFINAGALLAIRFKQANVIGITFVATAGVMDISALAKANLECTKAIYGQ